MRTDKDIFFAENVWDMSSINFITEKRMDTFLAETVALVPIIMVTTYSIANPKTLSNKNVTATEKPDIAILRAVPVLRTILKVLSFIFILTAFF